jgi:hypothetical protein
MGDTGIIRFIIRKSINLTTMNRSTVVLFMVQVLMHLMMAISRFWCRMRILLLLLIGRAIGYLLPIVLGRSVSLLRPSLLCVLHLLMICYSTFVCTSRCPDQWLLCVPTQQNITQII